MKKLLSKNLRLRMSYGCCQKANAHVIHRVNMGFAAYDTLCLICAELGADVNKISDKGFEQVSDRLDHFAKSANEKTGYTVTVWRF